MNHNKTIFVKEVVKNWTISVKLAKMGDSTSAISEIDLSKRTLDVVINKRLRLKEKVVSLIHEFLHLDKDLDKYIGFKQEMFFTYYMITREGRNIEHKIDNHAYRVYYQNPDLIDYLNKKYNLLGQRN